MQKKSKKPLLIMAAVSVIILILGFLCGIAVYSQIAAQVNAGTNNVIIDGTDISALLNVAGNAGAFVMGVIIFGISLVTIAVQWGIYGLVILIQKLSSSGDIESEKNVEHLNSIK